MPEPSSSSPIFQSQHDLGRTHETAASWLRERSKAATSKQSHFTKGLERRLRKPRETQASSLHDGSSELSQSTVLYVTSESPVTVRGCQHYVQRRQPEASEISTRPDATYETASSATLTEDSQYYSVREKRNESIKSVEEAVHLGRRGRHQQSEEGRGSVLFKPIEWRKPGHENDGKVQSAADDGQRAVPAIAACDLSSTGSAFSVVHPANATTTDHQDSEKDLRSSITESSADGALPSGQTPEEAGRRPTGSSDSEIRSSVTRETVEPIKPNYISTRASYNDQTEGGTVGSVSQTTEEDSKMSVVPVDIATLIGKQHAPTSKATTTPFKRSEKASVVSAVRFDVEPSHDLQDGHSVSPISKFFAKSGESPVSPLSRKPSLELPMRPKFIDDPSSTSVSHSESAVGGVEDRDTIYSEMDGSIPDTDPTRGQNRAAGGELSYHRSPARQTTSLLYSVSVPPSEEPDDPEDRWLACDWETGETGRKSLKDLEELMVPATRMFCTSSMSEAGGTTSQPPPDRPHPSRRKGRSTELRQPTVVSASEESHLESTPEALRIVHPYEVEMSPPTSDASRGYTGSRPYLVDLDSDLTGLYGPMTCLVFSDPGEVVISLSMYPPPRPPKIPLSLESHSDSGRYELPAIPPTEGQAFAARITDFESFIGPSDDPPNYSEVDGPRQSKIRWSKFQSEYSRVKSRIATRFRIFRPTSYGPSISQSSGYQSSSHSDPNSHAPSDSTPTRRPEWPSCLSRPAKRIIGKARAGRHANAMSTYLQDLALDMAKPKSPESIDPTRQSVPDSSMGSSRRFSSETPGQSRSDDQNLYWDSRFSVKDSPLTDSDFTGPRPSVWMFMGRAYRPRSPIQEASTVAPSHQFTFQVDPSEVETGWGLETLTAMGI